MSTFVRSDIQQGQCYNSFKYLENAANQGFSCSVLTCIFRWLNIYIQILQKNPGIDQILQNKNFVPWIDQFTLKKNTICATIVKGNNCVASKSKF